MAQPGGSTLGSDSTLHARVDSHSPSPQPYNSDNPGEFTRPPLKPVTTRVATNTGQRASDYSSVEEAHKRPQEELPAHFKGGINSNPKKQSLSFKVLQWMTETPAEENSKPVVEEKPRKTSIPRDTRHNAEDDEMRFSGLNKKTDIPSKSFQLLQKYNLLDENNQNTSASENKQNSQEEEPEKVGQYDETSIRYKGKHIPSPSFRVLKSWAEQDTPVESPNASRKMSRQEDSEDDGLPDTLSGEEMVDKRYKGGNIPSRVFKTLQRAVGDDTPENPSEGEPSEGGEPAKPARSIKVLAKAPANPPPEAVTDF